MPPRTESTTSLDSLFHYLAVLIVKKLIIMFKWDLLCFRLCTMPCVMSLNATESKSIFFTLLPCLHPQSGVYHTGKISCPSVPLLCLLFSRLNDPRSQSFLISGPSSPLMMLVGLLWTWSSKPVLVLYWGAQPWTTALQARSHQC